MSADPLEVIETTPDREIVTTRLVSASRSLVYKAWTDPNHLKNWWGPKGFTNTFNKFDLRPGGTWSFIMHDPNGRNYPNECIYVRIEEPVTIIWNHISLPRFQIEVKFDQLSENSTKTTFKMKFQTGKECEKVKAYAIPKNEENMDKLEAELNKMMNGGAVN